MTKPTTITDARVEAAARAVERTFPHCSPPFMCTWADVVRPAIEAAERAAWQPIATKPPSDENVLVRYADGMTSIDMWFEDSNQWELGDDPTHWRPLPTSTRSIGSRSGPMAGSHR